MMTAILTFCGNLSKLTVCIFETSNILLYHYQQNTTLSCWYHLHVKSPKCQWMCGLCNIVTKAGSTRSASVGLDILHDNETVMCSSSLVWQAKSGLSRICCTQIVLLCFGLLCTLYTVMHCTGTVVCSIHGAAPSCIVYMNVCHKTAWTFTLPGAAEFAVKSC